MVREERVKEKQRKNTDGVKDVFQKLNEAGDGSN